MSKKILLLFLLLLLVGCKNIKKEDIKKDSKEEMNTMKITIEDKEYDVELEDNDTVKSLLSLLPKEYVMHPLNENEIYVYIDTNLPTKTYYPKKIVAGDVMLYDNNCLVIFYKSFNTKYPYTKIGHIDNLPIIEGDSLHVKFQS